MSRFEVTNNTPVRVKRRKSIGNVGHEFYGFLDFLHKGEVSPGPFWRMATSGKYVQTALAVFLVDENELPRTPEPHRQKTYNVCAVGYCQSVKVRERQNPSNKGFLANRGIWKQLTLDLPSCGGYLKNLPSSGNNSYRLP